MNEAQQWASIWGEVTKATWMWMGCATCKRVTVHLLDSVETREHPQGRYRASWWKCRPCDRRVA